MDNQEMNAEKRREFLLEHKRYFSIIDQILDNTKIYKERDVLDGILDLIVEWRKVRKQRPLYIIKRPDDTGSESWLYRKFKDQLPPHKSFIPGMTDFPDEAIEVLFIDDWCLSGSHMAGQFENAFYMSPCKRAHCTIITYVCSSQARNLMKELETWYENIITTTMHAIQNIDVFIPVRPDNICLNEWEILYERFLDEMQDDTGATAHAVIYDYKIANQFGTYEKIYKACFNLKLKPYT